MFLKIVMMSVLILLSGFTVLAEEATEMKEIYQANAIALGKGMMSSMQITITRWTTDEERNALLTALVEQGQEAMIKILEKQKETGFLRLPNSMGYRLYYAHEIKNAGKRRIVLATDRPVSFAEAWRGGRSMDYAITLVELNLDEDNKGEGWMGFAVKLKMNQETKTLAIENYGTDPVELKAVRKTK